ncbi:MAG: hypothetical protein U1F77_08510 [Kiritimatiellia bacterium]
MLHESEDFHPIHPMVVPMMNLPVRASFSQGLCCFPHRCFYPGKPGRESDPDYKTLIFPSIIPKAGSSAPAANSDPGSIRNSYEGYYENFWTDVSYFRYDPATGLKLRGFYIDTKTYGYVHALADPAGQRRSSWTSWASFNGGDRLYSANIIGGFVADGTPMPSRSLDAGRGVVPGHQQQRTVGSLSSARGFLEQRQHRHLRPAAKCRGAPLGAIPNPSADPRNNNNNATNGLQRPTDELFADERLRQLYRNARPVLPHRHQQPGQGHRRANWT